MLNSGAVDRKSFVLSDTWDVGDPGLWGKRNHMCSLAADDDYVVLLVVVKPNRYVEWHCSPPDREDSDYAEGTIELGRAQDLSLDLAEVIEMAKQSAYEAWNRWISEGDLTCSLQSYT